MANSDEYAKTVAKDQQLLARMAGHLDGLAAKVHGLEHALSDAFGEDCNTSATTITHLQTLDFLRQSLEDCAIFVLFLDRHGVGQDLDVQDIANMADRLRLETTRALLTGGAVSLIPTLRDDMGDVDLF